MRLLNKKSFTALLALAMAGCMTFAGYAYTEAPASELGAFDMEGVTVENGASGHFNLLDFESKWADGGSVESRNPDILTASLVKLDSGLNVIQYEAKATGSAELVIINKRKNAAVNMGHVYVVDDVTQTTSYKSDNPETPPETENTGTAAGTAQWVSQNDIWKYQNADGTFVTSNWVLDNGKWYYFDANGILLANQWVSSNSQWYYVTGDGSMAVNTTTPDGYQVNSDGVMIE